MTDQFDAAEIRAALEAGIRPEPGLTPGLLAELNPLHGGGSGDGAPPARLGAADLNAALDSAAEGYSLTPFTPTGNDRSATLRLLTEFTELVASRQSQAAVDLLTRVGPDRNGALPAASHVIGAALDLLDAWLPGERPFHVLFQPYPSFGRRAAVDVLAAAEEGRAFDSLRELTAAHGGEALLHGASLSLASYLSCAAKDAGLAAAQLAGQLLTPPPGAGQRSGQPARRASWQRRLARSLEAWLTAEDLSPESVGQIMDSFDWLLDVADARGADIRTPGSVVSLWAAIAEDPALDATAVELLLNALDNYLSHRRTKGTDGASWEKAAADIENWAQAAETDW